MVDKIMINNTSKSTLWSLMIYEDVSIHQIDFISHI